MTRLTLLVLGLMFLIPSHALADIRTLDALQTFDGSPDPAGPVPWVRASFNDFDKGGHGPVTLTFEALNLIGTEHVTGLYLNLDPTFDATKLALFPIEKHGTFESPQVSFGNDLFQADGDGEYDIYFEFATGDQESVFGVGDSFSLRLDRPACPSPHRPLTSPARRTAVSAPSIWRRRSRASAPTTPQPGSQLRSRPLALLRYSR